jgi:hypothetical protein
MSALLVLGLIGRNDRPTIPYLPVGSGKALLFIARRRRHSTHTGAGPSAASRQAMGVSEIDEVWGLRNALRYTAGSGCCSRRCRTESRPLPGVATNVLAELACRLVSDHKAVEALIAVSGATAA